MCRSRRSAAGRSVSGVASRRLAWIIHPAPKFNRSCGKPGRLAWVCRCRSCLNLDASATVHIFLGTGRRILAPCFPSSLDVPTTGLAVVLTFPFLLFRSRLLFYVLSIGERTAPLAVVAPLRRSVCCASVNRSLLFRPLAVSPSDARIHAFRNKTRSVKEIILPSYLLVPVVPPFPCRVRMTCNSKGNKNCKLSHESVCLCRLQSVGGRTLGLSHDRMFDQPASRSACPFLSGNGILHSQFLCYCTDRGRAAFV